MGGGGVVKPFSNHFETGLLSCNSGLTLLSSTATHYKLPTSSPFLLGTLNMSSRKGILYCFSAAAMLNSNSLREEKKRDSELALVTFLQLPYSSRTMVLGESETTLVGSR